MTALSGVGPAFTVAWGMAGLVLGAIVGSFLATLVIRWPKGERTSGRSCCDSCGTPVAARDLVPVLSFAALRGKCRYCAAPIPRDHVRIEIVAALVGALSFAILPRPEGLALAVLGWLLLALGWLDARHLWLPVRLLLALAVGGLALGGIVSGLPLIDRLIGGAIGFAVLEIIRRAYRALRGAAGMGWGDPLLMGGIGLWCGWQGLAPTLLIGAGGLLGLAIASGRHRDAAALYPLGSGLAIGGFLSSAMLARMAF